MMTTEKHILDSQQVAPPLPDTLGITQSSGLDQLSRHPDKWSVVFNVKLTSLPMPLPCGPFSSARPIMEPWTATTAIPPWFREGFPPPQSNVRDVSAW